MSATPTAADSSGAVAPGTRLTIRRPDDWHVHLRDGAMLRAVVGHTARQFARAIVMPNLRPPITTAAAAAAYRQRILAALRESGAAGARAGDTDSHSGQDFTPLMTAYLTESLDPAELERGQAEGILTAAKLYPAGATTNSDAGVRDLAHIAPVLETMERIGLPLLIHGEVTDPSVDIFDREAVFIERQLIPLLASHPGLKVVLEHITTADAATFVAEAGPNLAATITPHHLHINRNALFAGGLRPDFYCLPVAKRERHRLALRAAATSGNPKFFLGTDSAPHSREAKESACGCAGIYNAPYAIESYAAVFEQEGALDRLEAFASTYGPRFYGLPLNGDTLTLERQDPDDDGAEAVPIGLELANGSTSPTHLVPFHAGEALPWRLA
ncbi:dihydroorotase [Vulcanococcus limneticus]|uniref:dihydroorotase n=1 Tax=Vulcanococcus limneticus TaxID=2170428 RepID=UPI000B97FE38|nr:dihydroorotase [Vulcanococcus limneticus]MCP9791789.1 dihydroorotase [Vulcanococcus limneticus MW73D5]MCP9893659.1 dihydroorotase [Vulcanococcus limneticus Candia 3F8]MCP9897245.1 dihydroorotase [Vulcanococcus limneticus Candia 3B3]